MTGEFLETLTQWWNTLSVDKVIMLVMMLFAAVGALDRICGNKRGYGAAFEEGICAMGSLALAVAAVYAASPLIAKALTPVVTPLFRAIGADPGVFPGIVMASDMGAYSLSMEMASTEALGNFGGLILGSTIGPTWIFTIPVALSLLKKEDRPMLAAGVLCGLMTVPLGCFAGGCLMALTPYGLPVGTILLNLVPVLALSAVVGAGLWFAPAKTIRVFQALGKGITAIVTALTAIAAFEQMTGIWFPVLDAMATPDAAGLTGLDRGLLLCGQIALVLTGAFPMVKWVSKRFSGALGKAGKRLGVNAAASAGFLAAAANSIPMFASMKDMDEKGKLLNAAFAVGGAVVLGDFLGFTAGVNPKMVLPMIGAKLVCGVSAVAVAHWLSPVLLGRIAQSGKGERRGRKNKVRGKAK